MKDILFDEYGPTLAGILALFFGGTAGVLAAVAVLNIGWSLLTGAQTCTNQWGPEAEWHLFGGCVVPFEGEMLPASLVKDLYQRNLGIEISDD
jgi:hypothetical protein